MKLSPADHGRRMALADFEFAECPEGPVYELSRGVITLPDVPNPKGGGIPDAIRLQMDVFRATSPGIINSIRSGRECKLLIVDLESERHPDLAIYKKPPPSDDRETWRIWIPELVIEVVTPGSRIRDYLEKTEEYLRLGIKEYWIVDQKKGKMTVLKRRGKGWSEREVLPGDPYETRLLPGFKFDLAQALAAAE